MSFKEASSRKGGNKRDLVSEVADYRTVDGLNRQEDLIRLIRANVDVQGQELVANLLEDKISAELAFNVDSVFPFPPNQFSILNRAEGLPFLDSGSKLDIIDKLIKEQTPTEVYKAITMAYGWDSIDDLLKSLINIYQDFTVIGANLQARTLSEESQDIEVDIDGPPADEQEPRKITPQQVAAQVELQKFLNRFKRKFQVIKVIEDLVRDWRISDSMILYWRIDTQNTDPTIQADSSVPTVATVKKSKRVKTPVAPGLQQLMALNPAEIRWDNSLGTNTMLTAIPTALKERILSAMKADGVLDGQLRVLDSKKSVVKDGTAVKELIASGVGIKWIDAIAAGSNFVPLRNEDGDYWIVRTKQRINYGLAMPSMRTVFLPLQCRRTLSEGLFAACYMTKHFIMLVQQGESIDQGPAAGMRTNWISPPDIKILEDKFKNAAKAMRVVCDHTVKVSFVMPPKEMWDSEKFEVVEGRVMNWIGITITIQTGEGGTYGSAFIGIKRLIASIKVCRSKVSEIFTEFFDHDTIFPYIPTENDSEEIDIGVTYNEQVLTEPVQLLKEVEFLFKSNIIDSRTAATELGRDPDAIRHSKRRTRAEDQEEGAWSSLPSQQAEQKIADGGADKTGVADKGGRPANSDTVPDAHTAQQPPGGQGSHDA